MPDRKKLPARSKLTKRADALRRAVRANGGKRDIRVRGGIGEPATFSRLDMFTKKPRKPGVQPGGTGKFKPNVKLDPSMVNDQRGKGHIATGNLSLARHNKSERAADPAGPTKTKVAVVRGREQTVATGPGGALSRSRVTPRPPAAKKPAVRKITKSAPAPKQVMKAPKRHTAGLGKGLRV